MLLLAAVAVSGTVSNQADPGYTKPHIFFLMMDDVGSMDVGWADDTVKTPTLTALANQGVSSSPCNHCSNRPVECRPGASFCGVGQPML